jgi:hypothetical protein
LLRLMLRVQPQFHLVFTEVVTVLRVQGRDGYGSARFVLVFESTAVARTRVEVFSLSPSDGERVGVRGPCGVPGQSRLLTPTNDF